MTFKVEDFQKKYHYGFAPSCRNCKWFSGIKQWPHTCMHPEANDKNNNNFCIVMLDGLCDVYEKREDAKMIYEKR